MLHKTFHFSSILNVLFLSILFNSFIFSISLKIKDQPNTEATNKFLNKKRPTKIGPCSCPETNKIPDNIKFNITSNSIVEERINGISFRPPININGYIFLIEDFPVSPSSSNIDDVCPGGYDAFTVNIWNDIKNKEGEDRMYELFFQKLNMNLYRKYIFGDKTYPNNTDPNSFDAFSYNRLMPDNTSGKVKFIIDDKNIFNSNKMFTKCFLSSNKYELRINIQTGNYDNTIYSNEDYEISIGNSNIEGAYWMIDDGNTKTYALKTIIQFKNEGCHNIYVWGLLLNGDISQRCKPVYVLERWGGQSAPKNAKIIRKVISFSQTNARKVREIKFAPVSVPFATDSNNNYCITYTDYKTNHLSLLYLDSNLNELSRHDLGLDVHALDITRKSSGFLIAAQTNDKGDLMLIGVDNNGKIEYIRVIFTGNGSTDKNEVVFHQPNGQIEFGINNIRKVITAKLSYTNNCIGIIVSLENNFGKDKSSNNLIAMGDMTMTFEENGKNEKLGYSWGSSPSLSQQIINDGYNFFTASLGGLYPENIKICSVDRMNLLSDVDPVRNSQYKHDAACMTLLRAIIPSDGHGKSCGLLGGILHNDGVFGVIYSRKPCKIESISPEDKNKKVVEESHEDNFGLVLFKKNFEILKRIRFGYGANILCINSALFKNYIAIKFTITAHSDAVSPYKDSYDPRKDLSFLMLVDFKGNIVQSPTQLPVTNCEEFSTLKDGSIANSSVDNNNHIVVTHVSLE